LLPAGDLAGFVDGVKAESSALGEEVSDFFDMDLGL
jgi:hypothetical protein